MMKRLDDTTLEVIAETICGAGQGAGGGASYEAPGLYRSMSEINAFFGRAGVQPQGDSSTRKWFVLESLQAINGTDKLEKVILRLASPNEYRGDADLTHKVIEHLNQVLRLEGFELELLGVSPQIRERTAVVSQPKPKGKEIEAPPDFIRLVNDYTLADILKFRWEEAQRCVRGGAYLCAVVMMGSILEAVLLYRVEENPKTANQTKSCPKDRYGNPKTFNEWGLSSLIDVAHEIGWLQGDVKRFSHALRESRNVVHPYVQRLLRDRPDEDTCLICWQVVKAALSDLLRVG